MTADEVMLKKKDPPPNPLYPDAGKAKPYPLTEIKVWDCLRKKTNPRPYLRVRNLNSPIDENDAGEKSKLAFEVGLKWTF